MGDGVEAKETAMKCPICRQGETKPGLATEVLQREGAVLVFRNVPAEICDVCGESYVESDTASLLAAKAEKRIAAGVRLEASDFQAA